MFDERFLEEEKRNSFFVTSNRKLLWKYEIDMLMWLESVCEIHNINYFLIGGSEIGAVRHNGFIPWDDDIDIGMLRSDFNKFLEVYREEIPNYYELQYRFSEKKDCWSNLCRIRDRRTTGIICNQIGKKISHGVFIEIYPYDYIPISYKEQQKLATKVNRLICILRDKIKQVPIKGIKLKIWKLCYLGISPEAIDKKIDRICQSYQNRGLVSTTMIPQYLKNGSEVLNETDVNETIKVPFEYTVARIPKAYHRCLTKQFGDYMKLPPKEERGVHHSTMVFYDPTKPYYEYVGESVEELISINGYKI